MGEIKTIKEELAKLEPLLKGWYSLDGVFLEEYREQYETVKRIIEHSKTISEDRIKELGMREIVLKLLFS